MLREWWDQEPSKRPAFGDVCERLLAFNAKSFEGYPKLKTSASFKDYTSPSSGKVQLLSSLSWSSSPLVVRMCKAVVSLFELAEDLSVFQVCEESRTRGSCRRT